MENNVYARRTAMKNLAEGNPIPEDFVVLGGDSIKLVDPTDHFYKLSIEGRPYLISCWDTNPVDRMPIPGVDEPEFPDSYIQDIDRAYLQLCLSEDGKRAAVREVNDSSILQKMLLKMHDEKVERDVEWRGKDA